MSVPVRQPLKVRLEDGVQEHRLDVQRGTMDAQEHELDVQKGARGWRGVRMQGGYCGLNWRY